MKLMHRKRVTQALGLALLAVAALVITVVGNFNTATTAEAALVRDVVVVGLHETNSSGQSGVAVLSEQANGTHVSVRINSGGAGIAQVVHVHNSTCAALVEDTHSLPRFGARLSDVSGGKSDTVIGSSLSSLLKGGFSISLHQSSGESVSATCGDIPTRASSVTMQVGTGSSASQTGHATISESSGGRTGVAISIIASPIPGRSQPASFRLGNCILPGVVEYSLSNVQDGRSVTILDVPYMAFRATGHIINVEKSTTNSSQAACADLVKAVLPSINKVVVVPLAALNSDQSGVALLISRGSKTEIIVSTNSTNAIAQPVNIHLGSCDVLGATTDALGNLENGWISAIADSSLTTLTAGGFSVNVQKSASESQINIACGEIPKAADRKVFRIAGEGTGAQVGYATVIASGANSKIATWVTPGAKGVAQPMHVKSGTCSNLGATLHTLASVVDGRSITTLAGVSMASLRDGSSVINLQKSATESSVNTACARIPSDAVVSSDVVVPTRTVSLTAGTFPDVSITSGTKVIWSNDSDDYYTITAIDGSFDSELLPKGFTYSRTFSMSGTYEIRDAFSGLTGTVTVQ